MSTPLNHTYTSHITIRTYICTPPAPHTPYLQKYLHLNTLSSPGQTTVHPLSPSHSYLNTNSRAMHPSTFSFVLGLKISPDEAKAHATGRPQFPHDGLAGRSCHQAPYLQTDVLPIQLSQAVAENGSVGTGLFWLYMKRQGPVLGSLFRDSASSPSSPDEKKVFKHATWVGTSSRIFFC
jgi:hypothetical protein